MRFVYILCRFTKNSGRKGLMKSRKYYSPIGLFYSALNKALDKFCLNIYSQNLRPIEQKVKKT